MQSSSAEPALGTLLLVDDDLELSDTMSEFLKIHGYVTLQAQNGQNAIDLLKTMAAFPILIVLDMSMPVLDGRGFLKRRVKDSVLLGIPVVVVSGSDAPASPPMNIIAYLRKPISMKRLMSIIESAFDDSSVWPNLPTSSEPRLCAFFVNINAAPPTRICTETALGALGDSRHPMRGINPQHAPELGRKLLAGVPDAIGGEIAKSLASTVPQRGD